MSNLFSIDDSIGWFLLGLCVLRGCIKDNHRGDWELRQSSQSSPLEQDFAFARGKDVAVLWSALFAGPADVTKEGRATERGFRQKTGSPIPWLSVLRQFGTTPPKLELDLPWLMQGIQEL